MQIVSVEALLSINETLIVQLISFLVFLFVINRVMFRPLRGLIKKRGEHLDAIKHDISEADNEYQHLLKQIKKRESAVKNEAFAFQQKLEESGSEEAARIIETTRKEISDLKQKVGRELEDQISEVREGLQKESETIALVIMEKILDRGLQP